MSKVQTVKDLKFFVSIKGDKVQIIRALLNITSKCCSTTILSTMNLREYINSVYFNRNYESWDNFATYLATKGRRLN